jgi:hypothetical protein
MMKPPEIALGRAGTPVPSAPWGDLRFHPVERAEIHTRAAT